MREDSTPERAVTTRLSADVSKLAIDAGSAVRDTESAAVGRRGVLRERPSDRLHKSGICSRRPSQSPVQMGRRDESTRSQPDGSRRQEDILLAEVPVQRAERAVSRMPRDCKRVQIRLHRGRHVRRSETVGAILARFEADASRRDLDNRADAAWVQTLLAEASLRSRFSVERARPFTPDAKPFVQGGHRTPFNRSARYFHNSTFAFLILLFPPHVENKSLFYKLHIFQIERRNARSPQSRGHAKRQNGAVARAEYTDALSSAHASQLVYRDRPFLDRPLQPRPLRGIEENINGPQFFPVNRRAGNAMSVTNPGDAPDCSRNTAPVCEYGSHKEQDVFSACRHRCKTARAVTEAFPCAPVGGVTQAGARRNRCGGKFLLFCDEFTIIKPKRKLAHIFTYCDIWEDNFTGFRSKNSAVSCSTKSTIERGKRGTSLSYVLSLL